MTSNAQFWKRKLNQVDNESRKKGLWIDYWDKDKKQIMTKYHFKNGRETKVCKNFHPNGKISIKFKYIKDRIKVKYYNEEGKLTQKGWSIIKYEEKIHYYWHGRWKFYEPGHRLVRKALYMNGALINPTQVKKIK